MKATYFTAKDFLYIVPVSLALGIAFSLIEHGGLLAFSLLFLLFILLLKIAHDWSGGGKTLGYVITLAFLLRLAVGVTLHLGLPVFGHTDEDDRAGYVYTD